MKLTGWGKYPSIDAELASPATSEGLLRQAVEQPQPAQIARGLGRSYGDSALAPHIISTVNLDQQLAFDEASGLLTCAAGASLEGILRDFVPKGWFLPVTPGTKFVTVGGAVASDVHGKNHHLEGSFANHLTSLKVATVSEGIVECSRNQRPELFHATCGGMGLTGVVMEATFQLKRIRSASIDQTLIKANNLGQALALFEEHHTSTYSLAWVDCLATGKSFGRSLLMLGEHAEEGDLIPGKPSRLAVPVDMPSALLNRPAMQLFNTLYYYRALMGSRNSQVHYEPFFYPLDGIHHWNRMYGKKGFTQYQFVLPKAAGLAGINALLGRIAASKHAPFLAVLKVFGKGNGNYLSFPMEGYTLALDFKLKRGLFQLLDELDEAVIAYGGRIYLAKDARMSEATLKQGYPDWQRFMEVRRHYGADKVFNSLQSQRLGL